MAGFLEDICSSRDMGEIRNPDRSPRYIQMSENALQKAVLYREEAVALKAVHYYNSVIAENAAQKKRNIRLLLEG